MATETIKDELGRERVVIFKLTRAEHDFRLRVQTEHLQMLLEEGADPEDIDAAGLIVGALLDNTVIADDKEED